MKRALELALAKRVDEVIALAMDTTAAAAFIDNDINKEISREIFLSDPLLTALEKKKVDSKIYEWKKVTDMPSADAEGENATTVASDMTAGDDTVTMKVVRSKGSVTGLASAATVQDQVDLFQEDLDLRMLAMKTAISGYVRWGNATADAYQFNGLNAVISSNRTEHAGTITTALLDSMIDAIPAELHDSLMFEMSSQMISKLSTLDPTIRKTIDKVEFAGGRRMARYRNIPLNPSSFVRPTTQFGAVGVADAGAGGALDAGGTYNYYMSAITSFGEQYASPVTNHVLAGGQNETTVSWTAVAGAKLYRIYRTEGAGAANTAKLLVELPAHTYDGNGTITGNVTSYNDKLADTVVAAAVDYPLQLADADEVIFLTCLNKKFSLELAILPQNQRGVELKDRENLVYFKDLADTNDADNYQLQSYLALAVKNENKNAMARRVRAV